MYRHGLDLDYENPSLRNNLASVLGDLGCARAGEAVLQPAAERYETDSNWRPVIQRTRSELAARKGRDPDTCVTYNTGQSELPKRLRP